MVNWKISINLIIFVTSYVCVWLTTEQIKIYEKYESSMINHTGSRANVQNRERWLLFKKHAESPNKWPLVRFPSKPIKASNEGLGFFQHVPLFTGFDSWASLRCGIEQISTIYYNSGEQWGKKTRRMPILTPNVHVEKVENVKMLKNL